MKKISTCLRFFAVLLSIFSFGGFAAESLTGLEGLEKTGFKIQPLINLENSKEPFHCQLFKFYKSYNEKYINQVFVVTDYPKAPGKNEANYAPLRTKIGQTEDLVPLETVVLSRYNGTDGGAHLSKILDSWIEKGFSSHFIVTLDGKIIPWVNPILCKGQMAGTWNARSAEILAATDEKQCITKLQADSVASIVKFVDAFANAKGEKIRYMLSHGEARGSEKEGTISNLDDVRKYLGLINDNKEHNQVLLS